MSETLRAEPPAQPHVNSPSDMDHDKFILEGHLKAHIPKYGRSQDDDDDDSEESFFVADLGEVYRQYSRWTKNLERVRPFYAVKCNPDREVLRLLARLGAGFDCSSRDEIERVLALGVGCNEVLYANPCKARSHLRYAHRAGIRRMTFDGVDELHKIKAISPGAELLLRIATDDSSSVCRFSHKFGAPLSSIRKLLETARDLKLNIVGVSFHIGSGATDPQLFAQAVQNSRMVFNYACEYGHSPTILDIGGGFSATSFEVMSKTLAIALDEHFPGNYDLIAEPGRYFVESAFTLACNIIARRDVLKQGTRLSYMLFLNDGVYSNFMDSLLSHWRRSARILRSSNEEIHTAAIRYSIWGPTCDGVDQILENAHFHKLLDIGDWLYFENMGAYSSCLATGFNGFSSKQIVHYISTESDTDLLSCC